MALAGAALAGAALAGMGGGGFLVYVNARSLAAAEERERGSVNSKPKFFIAFRYSPTA
jgi:hypothetical protein